MAEVAHTPRAQSFQMAGAITGALAASNTAFFFLSSLYFGAETSGLMAARVAFAVMTVIVAVISYGAALAPRQIGHGIAVAFGLASLVGGIEAIAHDLPGVMGATLLFLGVLLPVLAWRSWHHSRPAWAFLIALIAVFAAVDFFGAPKIRNLLGIGLWHAMIFPSLQIVGVVALAMVRGEYRER